MLSFPIHTYGKGTEWTGCQWPEYASPGHDGSCRTHRRDTRSLAAPSSAGRGSPATAASRPTFLWPTPPPLPSGSSWTQIQNLNWNAGVRIRPRRPQARNVAPRIPRICHNVGTACRVVFGQIWQLQQTTKRKVFRSTARLASLCARLDGWTRGTAATVWHCYIGL